MKQLGMAFTVVIAGITVASFSLPQNSPNDLQRELERLHNQWFTAFDKGDGATMDRMEVPNLILVNADGKAAFGTRMISAPASKSPRVAQGR